MIIELKVDHVFVGTSNALFVVFKDGRGYRTLRTKRDATYVSGQLVKVVLDENEEFIGWLPPSNVYQMDTERSAG